MKRVEKGRITAAELIAENLVYLKINMPCIAGDALPGNFVSLLPPASSGKYLRRPFSIAGTGDESIELVIKNIGPVTSSLAQLEAGSTLDALGPLGNSYSLKAGNIWMIGGGTGIASILFLNSSLADSRVRVMWAGKSRAALPSPEIFNAPRFRHIFRSNITLATDDGSAGEEGTAPQVLERWIKAAAGSLPDAIVSCGPHGMMKAVKDIADREGIPAWFSLEEFMACGAGACAGCAVPAAGGGYLKACDDGPVFSGSRIIL